MQLHFNNDDLNLLSDILLSRAGTLSAQAQASAGSAVDERTAKATSGLLDKVLVRDLRFDSDELEQLADLLGEQKRELRDQMTQLQDPVARPQLQQRLRLVERILERVDEAWAMI